MQLINTTSATSGSATAYLSGAPELNPGLKWGSRYSIFSFMWMFCRSLFVLFFVAIVLSVLHRFTDSGYSFGIFKLFIYIYVWKLNQTVLELYFRAVKFLFFPRRDLNPHHSLSLTSSALDHSTTSTPYIHTQVCYVTAFCFKCLFLCALVGMCTADPFTPID